MDGSLPQLALVVALILLNAAFSGSEMALISLREGQLKRLGQEGERGRVLSRLAGDPNRFLATIQVGITLAGFLASATAAVALAEPLEEPLDFLGGAARGMAIVIVTLALAFVTLVLGELAPKRLAMQRAERWAMLAARPLAGIAALARPVIWLLATSTDLVVRVLGGDPARQREAVTEEELRDLVAAQVTFSPEHREIISGAFEIAERKLREVLVPRGEVVWVEADESAEDAVRTMVAARRSRAPVSHGDVDEVVGVVHVIDLLDGGGVAGDHATPMSVFPETVGVLDALRALQQERHQMAIVVNEHGGVEGIVTVEDLLEELVGEIYDETDPDVAGVVREPDGALVLPGSFPIHDLDDIGVELPESDAYTTVAGQVLAELGHLPRVGEIAGVAGWRIEVLEVRRRAITRVRLRPVESGDTPPE